VRNSFESFRTKRSVPIQCHIRKCRCFVYIIYNIIHITLQYDNIILNIYAQVGPLPRTDFFSFSKFKRRLQEPISPHVLCSCVYMVHYVFCFFPGTRPWEKTERAPLFSAYVGRVRIHAILTIFHPGEMPTRRRDGFADTEG